MTDLVVLSLEAWDGVWRRNQYLVDGLLARHDDLRVLFVEPPRDHVHALLTGRGVARSSGLRTHAGYGGRLRLLQPGKLLPRVAGPAADALLRAGLARALRRVGMHRGVLWLNDPSWADLVPRRGWGSLYDITDDWLAAARAPRQLARTTRQEDRLLRHADAVVVCSTVLAERRRAQRPDAVLIPNAVDVARYRRPRERPADLPNGPLATYVGTLHEDRLDLEVVLATGAALAAAGGHLLLVGPVALAPATAERLGRAPGIRLLGPRDRDEVPAYLQHADALVVPHVVDAFTDSLDPIKLYEYLAVGRPVVATPVSGFRDLTPTPSVVVVPGAEFPAAVVATLAAPPSAAPVDVATWDDRVAEMDAVLAGIRNGPRTHAGSDPTARRRPRAQ